MKSLRKLSRNARKKRKESSGKDDLNYFTKKRDSKSQVHYHNERNLVPLNMISSLADTKENIEVNESGKVLPTYTKTNNMV
jgi:hypothetical protein